MGEVAELITSIATLLGVLLSIFISLRSLKKVERVEVQTNGMMKHLEDSATAAGHAAGVEQERRDADDRASDKP